MRFFFEVFYSKYYSIVYGNRYVQSGRTQSYEILNRSGARRTGCRAQRRKAIRILNSAATLNSCENIESIRLKKEKMKIPPELYDLSDVQYNFMRFRVRFLKYEVF